MGVKKRVMEESCMGECEDVWNLYVFCKSCERVEAQKGLAGTGG